ncbi:MAG: hypothetical protein ACRC10_11340 [Thermoguttaceae bacterium]
MLRLFFQRTCFLICVLFFLSDPLAYALEIQEIQVGINGYYKNGMWTPIYVSWTSEPVDPLSVFVDVLTVDSDGTPVYTKTASSVFTNCGSALVYVKLGQEEGNVTVQIRSQEDAQILAQHSIEPVVSEIRGFSRTILRSNDLGTLFLSPIPTDRPFYLLIGDSDTAVQEVIGQLLLKDNRRPVIVLLDSLERLPNLAIGYDAVELVILTTSIPSIFENRTNQDVRIQALSDWLALGGKMLFCPGENSEPFLAQSDSPLVPFLPGRFRNMTELRSGKALELYTGSHRPIYMDGTDLAPYMKLPVLGDVDGKIEVVEGDLPIVIRSSYGFGTLTYFAGDLDAPALKDWRERSRFLLQVLGWNDTKGRTTSMESLALIHLGYSDISGQIRSSTDQWTGLQIVPFSLLLILLVLYLGVVGPLDWLLVHKILKRPQWTWITFPLEITLFCLIALSLGSSARNYPLALNQVDLFDIDAKTGLMRTSSWLGIFSPQDATYHLSLRPETQSLRTVCKADRFHLNWLGLAGSGLGGMNPKRVSPTLWDQPYLYRDDSPDLQDVPILVRSSKTFFGEWSVGAEQVAVHSGPQKDLNLSATNSSSLFGEIRLIDREGVPRGTLVNDLPVPLENALLVYGRWALKLGRLEPGQSLNIGTQTVRRELPFILNSTEMGLDDSQNRIGESAATHKTSYNPRASDAWPILRTLSFFEAFGGVEKIGLDNSLHPHLDWSPLLQTNSAVLIGSVPPDSLPLGSRLTLSSDGVQREYRERKSLVVRVLLSVQKQQ